MNSSTSRLTPLTAWLAVTGALLSVSVTVTRDLGFFGGLAVGLLLSVVLVLLYALGAELRRTRAGRRHARPGEIDPRGDAGGSSR